jgi:hypothetical protein
LENPDKVLLDPQNARVPSDPATMYALCGALAERANATNADRLIQYARRIPEEFGVLLVSESVRQNEDIQYTGAFVDWCSENSDVIL